MTKYRAIASLVGSAIGFLGLLTITAPASATDCPVDMHWCAEPAPVAANPAVFADPGVLGTVGEVA